MAHFPTYPGVSQPMYQPNSMLFLQDQDAIIMEEGCWLSRLDPMLREFSNSASSDQPLERFLTEPEKPLINLPFFQNQQVMSLPHNMNGIFDASYAPSHPQAYQPRLSSPTLSHERSSICSGSFSPQMDLDWSGENYQSYNNLPSSRATSTSQSPPESSWDVSMSSGCEPRRHINMSQVQGVPDDQEPRYEEDSGYTTVIQQKPHFFNTSETSFKTNGSFSSFHCSTTEDNLSQPPHKSTHDHIKLEHSDYPLSELDAEGEEDDEAFAEIDTIVAKTEADADANDDSYHPHAPRKRTHRQTRPGLLRSKRSRNKKAIRGRTISPMQCRSCSHAPFKDANALEKHANSAHTRTYSCTFSFAGCDSVFGSKNEWKRHVASQHLCLNYWECTLDGCGSRPKSTSIGKTSIFNRKDLFTQHLRRMHAPSAAKRSSKKIPKWESDITRLQTECLRIRREAPRSLACGRCSITFDKDNAWDQRMEHFAKHAEAGENVSVDQGLVDWAVREGIVKSEGRGWELVSSANLGRGFYEDAEGEDDD